MRTLMRKIILIPLWILLSILWANAKVVIYSVPASETLSVDYVIEVDGKPIPVYTALTQHHDKKYSIAYFDFSGNVTVKIKSKFSLEKLAVLPNKYGICPSVHQDEAIFQLDKPCDISFEPDGCNSPLLLFTNELEEAPPL